MSENLAMRSMIGATQQTFHGGPSGVISEHWPSRATSLLSPATVSSVADPNYIKPEVAAEAREAAVRLLEPSADVYWRAVDLWNVISRALPDDAPGRLYIVWGELTDMRELHVEKRSDAENLMREAAEQFVAINDYPSELDGYLTRWYQRLRIPD